VIIPGLVRTRVAVFREGLATHLYLPRSMTKMVSVTVVSAVVIIVQAPWSDGLGVVSQLSPFHAHGVRPQERELLQSLANLSVQGITYPLVHHRVEGLNERQSKETRQSRMLRPSTM
jgi:hypothetical protein